jgi:hypothetical protein
MTGDERGGEDVEAIVDVEAMAAVDLSPKHPRLISPRTQSHLALARGRGRRRWLCSQSSSMASSTARDGNGYKPARFCQPKPMAINRKDAR